MAQNTTLGVANSYSTGTKIIKVTLEAHATTGAILPITVSAVAGRRLRQLVFINGTTGLTAASTMSVTDTLSAVNQTSSNGTAMGGDSVTKTVAPNTTDPVIIGNLTVAFASNVVNSATGTLYIVVV